MSMTKENIQNRIKDVITDDVLNNIKKYLSDLIKSLGVQADIVNLSKTFMRNGDMRLEFTTTDIPTTPTIFKKLTINGFSIPTLEELSDDKQSVVL